MNDPLESLVGHLALHEPFEKSSEELHRTAEFYTSVFGPPGELPAGFGTRVRRMMDRYVEVGLRSS